MRRLLHQTIAYPIRPLSSKSIGHLTLREIQILKLVAKGITNAQIAEVLNLSIGTIKRHFADLFNKLNVSSRTEAIIFGLRNGLLDLDDLG